MKTTPTRKPKWPKRIALGNVTIVIYKRTTPNGKTGFMLAYKQDGKRKFDSYGDEATAIQEANTKARQLSTLGVKAAQLTDDDLRACVTAMDAVKPLGISLTDAVSRFVEAFNIAGDVVAAAKFYKARKKPVTPKLVADVVAEMISVKELHGASKRYLQDLGNRLKRFAADFTKNAFSVTTADIQAWLDNQHFAAENYMSFRRVINVLFVFAVRRGYAHDNPVLDVENVKVKHGETQIFTPQEIAKLLAAAPPEFLPVLAIGAFAGLRSAELERLEWSDVDLEGGHITIGADKAKTASRRVVPISDNLAAWLAKCDGQQGNVWKGRHHEFYVAQEDTAKAADLKWKQNALRHSFCSYRLAKTQNAAQVALEAGNSPQMIFAHYHALVKPADALQWFSVLPEGEAAPVTTKVVPVVSGRRGSSESVARLPAVGTAAAN